MRARRSMIRAALQVVLLAGAGHIIGRFIVAVPSHLELLVLIGTAAFYPILRRPIIGMYAVCIGAPFIPYVRRLYYLGYARPQTDPLIMLAELFLVLMLAGLFFELRELFQHERPLRPYLVFIAGYCSYLALRMVLFTYVPLEQGILLFKYYGVVALFFFVGAVYASQTTHLKRFWYLTLLIAVAGALYGIQQLFVGYSRAEEMWFSSIQFSTLFIKGIARPFSFLQAPSAFAEYLLLGILGMLMAGGWLGKPYRWVLIALTALPAYGILITSVRSSWIGMLAIPPLWYGILKVRGTRARCVAGVLCVLLFVGYQTVTEVTGSDFGIDDVVRVLGGSLGNAEIIDLFVTTRTSAVSNPFEEHSFLSRMALWSMIIRLSSEPTLALMGRGLGALKADSLYFTYLAEFGYPGLLLILSVFGVFLARGLRVIDRHPDPDVVVLARGIMVMNVVFALLSVTGNPIHAFPGDVYFWFWNGVLVRLSTQLPSPDPAADGERGTA